MVYSVHCLYAKGNIFILICFDKVLIAIKMFLNYKMLVLVNVFNM